MRRAASLIFLAVTACSSPVVEFDAGDAAGDMGHSTSDDGHASDAPQDSDDGFSGVDASDASRDAAVDVHIDTGTRDMGERCPRTRCTTHGFFCDGDQLIDCRQGVDFCFYERVWDCADRGLVCDPDELSCEEPCSDDAPSCTGHPVGTSCTPDGRSVIVCEDVDNDGCLEADLTLCGSQGHCEATRNPPECIITGGICGDGAVGPSETCDDGGTVDGDGCSSACIAEFGWDCRPAGTACSRFPSIGAFSATETIPVQSGGPIAEGDWTTYMLTLSETTLLRTTLTVDSGDPWVIIRGADGSIIGSQGGASNDFIHGFLPGTYSFMVYAVFGTGAVNQFDLALTATPLTTTDLGVFGVGATIPRVSDSLREGESLYYLISFSDPVTLDGVLGGNSTGETGLLLQSPTQRHVLATNVGDDVFSAQLPAGDYLIRVVAFVGTGDVDTFTLDLTVN